MKHAEKIVVVAPAALYVVALVAAAVSDEMFAYPLIPLKLYLPLLLLTEILPEARLRPMCSWGSPYTLLL